MSVSLVTHEEQPELDEREEIWRTWPAFMHHEPVARERWHALYERFPAFQFFAVDDETGEIVAKANAIPCPLDADRLPDEGWAEALRSGVDQSEPPTVVSALQIALDPSHRGSGLSRVMLDEMRRIAVEHGFDDLVAPVRPNWKSRYPLTPMERYVGWTTGDGLPFDPWMRVHTRAGAEVVRVCARSMTIPGTVAEWEDWAQMRFPESGDYIVTGALEPVTIDVAADRGLYVEPNVWMRHRLA
jgi:GNAT superfamily N-acetyltransferase